MRWLITGGCGFIGLNLTRHLLRRSPNTRIRIFDNLSVGSRSELEYAVATANGGGSNSSSDERWELIVGDVCDSQAVAAAIRDVDVVVHLAAKTGVVPSVEDPKADFETNVIGTLNCLEAVRRSKVKCFVYASSGAPLGDRPPPLNEEIAARPASPYAAAKLASEGYCLAYHRAYDTPSVVLRFSNVYGPFSSRKESVVARYIRNVLDEETLTVFGDGSQTRDYIFVEDVAQAIVAAVGGAGIGELFHICTGVETSLLDLVGRLSGQFPSKPLNICHKPARKGEVLRSCADPGKALRILGWSAERRLDEGLGETVAWFRTRSSQSKRVLT